MHNWANACRAAVFFISVYLLSAVILKVLLFYYSYIFIAIIVLIPVVFIVATIIKLIWYVFDKDS